MFLSLLFANKYVLQVYRTEGWDPFNPNHYSRAGRSHFHNFILFERIFLSSQTELASLLISVGGVTIGSVKLGMCPKFHTNCRYSALVESSAHLGRTIKLNVIIFNLIINLIRQRFDPSALTLTLPLHTFDQREMKYVTWKSINKASSLSPFSVLNRLLSL